MRLPLTFSVQVNIPSTSGDMGVLANHVPSIEQLKAGLLEVFTEGGSKEDYFVAGGFAIVQPGSKLSINAVEAYKLEDFSKEVSTSYESQLNAGYLITNARSTTYRFGRWIRRGHF